MELRLLIEPVTSRSIPNHSVKRVIITTIMEGMHGAGKFADVWR